LKYASLILALIFLYGCGDNSTSGDPKTAPVAVVCMGGLGSNQLGEIETALAEPDRAILSTGGWDGYKSGLSVLLTNAKGKRILICHSFGCDSGIQQINAGLNVDRIICIDPVSTGWLSELPAPNAPCIVYVRSAWDIEPIADIVGTTPIVIGDAAKPTHHNDLCQDERLITRLQQDVHALQ
jgi:hypothetical protein